MEGNKGGFYIFASLYGCICGVSCFSGDPASLIQLRGKNLPVNLETNSSASVRTEGVVECLCAQKTLTFSPGSMAYGCDTSTVKGGAGSHLCLQPAT